CAQSVMDGPEAKIVPQVDMLFGMLAFAEGRTEEALAHLRQVEQVQPRLRGLHHHLGQAYLRMARWQEAEQAFTRELEIDPDCAGAHHGLAVALLQQERNEDAADHALTAVGLTHHFPLAHYHLGVAVTRLGMLDRAVQAFETCLTIAPDLIEA